MSIELEVTKPTPVQQRVIAALVQGATVSDAAKAVGLHRTTVHYWCRTQPHFRLALERAKQLHADFVRDELRALTHEAVDLLRTFLTGGYVPAATKLRAALAIIQSSLLAEAGPITNPLLPQAHLDAICAEFGDAALRAAIPAADLHQVASSSAVRESQVA